MNQPHPKEQQAERSFEQAFQRLEAILEALNSSHSNLDEAVSLFTEADELIRFCNKKLTEAERKIEILIKNRSGELQVNQETHLPVTQDFPL